jgi:molecular chaperone DnaJ
MKEKVTVMAAKRDYYEILGINRSADAAAIKKAYRKLAKKYHPDTNSGDVQMEQKFKEVTEAYTILSDPKKRKLYDQFGHAAFEGSAEGANPYEGMGNGFYGGASYGNNGKSYQEYHFEGGNMDDIFGDLFGGMFGGKSRHTGGYSHGFGEDSFGRNGFYGGASAQEKGRDLQADVSVSFEEAAFGCDKVIRIQDGKGTMQSLQVHIPAGIDDGKNVRLRGKGQPGFGGAQSGDLLLKVHIQEKPGFERKGMDVYTTVFVPFTTAVFGGEVPVQTIDGRVLCKIKAGTQCGSRIRLKGKGIVSVKNEALRGDQYVTVQIEVPKYLGAEEAQKLKAYEQAHKACAQGKSRGSAA